MEQTPLHPTELDLHSSIRSDLYYQHGSLRPATEETEKTKRGPQTGEFYLCEVALLLSLRNSSWIWFLPRGCTLMVKTSSVWWKCFYYTITGFGVLCNLFQFLLPTRHYLSAPLSWQCHTDCSLQHPAHPLNFCLKTSLPPPQGHLVLFLFSELLQTSWPNVLPPHHMGHQFSCSHESFLPSDSKTSKVYLVFLLQKNPISGTSCRIYQVSVSSCCITTLKTSMTLKQVFAHLQLYRFCWARLGTRVLLRLRSVFSFRTQGPWCIIFLMSDHRGDCEASGNRQLQCSLTPCPGAYTTSFWLHPTA